MRVEVGVHEVLEVGKSVLGGHREEGLDVLALPVEVAGDVVGGDREREGPPVGIPLGHHVDERAVDHRHLGRELAVGDVLHLAADERALVGEVVGAHPVEGEVGERGLGAPPARYVEIEDELLHLLPHLVGGEAVAPHVGGEVGVERRERLRARPLVLERSEEVDQLPEGAREVARGSARDAAGHPAETLLEHHAQRPSGAVPGEDVEVVDVQVSGAVRLAGLGGVDLVEPVVGDELAGRIQHHATE